MNERWELETGYIYATEPEWRPNQRGGGIYSAPGSAVLVAFQGGQPQSAEQQAAQAEAAKEADQQRQGMLHSIMQPAARERRETPPAPFISMFSIGTLDPSLHDAHHALQVVAAPKEVHLQQRSCVHSCLHASTQRTACSVSGCHCQHCKNAVARIALVKPEKARGVEDILLNAAKRGQLGQKVLPPSHSSVDPVTR